MILNITISPTLINHQERLVGIYREEQVCEIGYKRRVLMSKSKADAKEKNNMKWWQLSLFGVGCTIGTGFFLGSGIAIKMTGPSILIAFMIAALGTYFVYDALSKMTSKEPLKGGFRS